jgi:UDPglucose 6-dehydrogenase
MNICVLGLWHLGPVTAAGLAALGHRVVAVDFDESRVMNLNRSHAPVSEPGLEELIRRGLGSGNLRFSTTLDPAEGIDLLWVTFDTTADEGDQTDVDYYLAQIEHALKAVGPDVPVIISSQLPVGSVRRLEQRLELQAGARPRCIAYSPENLRLGNALHDFLHPNRSVVGVRSAKDRALLQDLLGADFKSIEWMSVESAEMTKHAINAFLAMSISFANEIGSLCELSGADSKEVERGLKSEIRIGPRAYVSAGAAFAGGTLARDVAFLNNESNRRGALTPLLAAVLPSNEAHKRWAQQKLRSVFTDLSSKTIAVWGLTYKPGTDSLRQSLAVELCNWLIQGGATTHVHDPAAGDLPAHWRHVIERFDDPVAALRGAHALVIATEWPEYRDMAADRLTGICDDLIVVDANRFVPTLAAMPGVLKYFAVGLPLKDI